MRARSSAADLWRRSPHAVMPAVAAVLLLLVSGCTPDAPTTMGSPADAVATADESIFASGSDADAGPVGVDGGTGDADATDAVDSSAGSDSDAGATDTQDSAPDVKVDPCSQKSCDDGNACTTDTCGTTGCVHVNSTASCDTAAAVCPTSGVCVGGACVAPAEVCGDGVCGCSETPASCASDCEAAMATLPAGTFAMGSANGVGSSLEWPQHLVTLGAFQLDKTEVTVAHYGAFYNHLNAVQQCAAANATAFVCGQPDKCNFGVAGWEQQPINCVDWFQADAYCKWAHVGGRLPTEAEWEYAARSGGKEQEYPWGNELPTCATYAIFMETTMSGCGANSTWPVCSKPAGNSSQGACDLTGNVWEWCSDWFGGYDAVPQTDPSGAAWGTQRSLRGGSWFQVTVPGLRVRHRFSGAPSSRNVDFGFRCARTL